MKEYKREVRQRLGNIYYLRPVFDDLYEIGRRIREVDDTLFIVRNTFTNQYEVHCLLHRPNTLAWVIPWKTLDGRVIEKALDNRVERHRDIAEEVRLHNEKIEIGNRKALDNDLDAMSRDLHPMFRKAAYDRG